MNTGIIEGFFGKPWEWSARETCIDFLRDWGYQFYIYAPKADPFLRRRWREPMPEATLRHLSELAARGVASGISIGTGLTPFEIYMNYDASARTLLTPKNCIGKWRGSYDQAGRTLYAITFSGREG